MSGGIREGCTRHSAKLSSWLFPHFGDLPEGRTPRFLIWGSADSPLPLLTDLRVGGPALIVTWSWNFKAQSALYLAGLLALHLTVGRREAEAESGLGAGPHRLPADCVDTHVPTVSCVPLG